MLILKLAFVFSCLGVVASAKGNEDLWSLIKRLLRDDKEVSNRKNSPRSADVPKNIRPVLADPFVEKEKRGIHKRNGATLTGFTASLRDLVLTMHNDARTNVDPAAVPELENMAWNETLAGIAAGWAIQCIWGHNPSRSNSINGYVGENIAILSDRSDTDVITDAMNGFIGEKDFYTYTSNACQSGKQCGHYTQIVWKQSVKVGCAIARCPEVTNAQGFCNAKYLVCNYYYGGNWIGYLPYETS